MNPNHDLQTPLRGVRVVEFEGIGPGPVAGRILAAMGADVTVIARPVPSPVQQMGGADYPLRAGKKVVGLDLKKADDLARALDLVAGADALIEGSRPGVMERLGLGPEACRARNPKLVYGRMTGWGQQGPLAQSAGHDLNYVALTGLLSLAARPGQAPIVPPTVVGDAAGALGLAFGIVCGVLDARSSGIGRVVDAAIVDVVAMLGTLVHWLHASDALGGGRPSPFHDSPQYDTYACADGGYITIGALEPQFYALLLDKLGMTDVDPREQGDTDKWPTLKARFASLFRTRTRDEWSLLLEGTDVCFAPVLSIDEAALHPHNVARGLFPRTASGAIDTQVAPRFTAL
ncbi:CaiB/BaiF CoA-transferase family protein [Variovorax sp. J22P168]|uniref:CaiB/BaiF CoA transferase family protein n=1 Tax=Variovorax jilinensis TaxID=3053513 RepID=UPI0025769787|nr:CaiB/BaiF CoA-transferase family protein [Variovorax sp. J22P168]MDM0014702.1 CaiB/BaiF CoA-transferase family protein [Variovorax sp. J22P168]